MVIDFLKIRLLEVKFEEDTLLRHEEITKNVEKTQVCEEFSMLGPVSNVSCVKSYSSSSTRPV